MAPGGYPEHTDLTERLAASVYRQGEAKRKAGDEAGAATDFQRVAQVAPESKIVPTARYDTAASLINTKQWPAAIDALEAYRRHYPQTEYGADITRKLAVAYVAGRGTQGRTPNSATSPPRREDRIPPSPEKQPCAPPI